MMNFFAWIFIFYEIYFLFQVVKDLNESIKRQNDDEDLSVFIRRNNSSLLKNNEREREGEKERETLLGEYAAWR